MAASYLADHTDAYKGSYSTEDLSNGTVEALSIYGSEDKVMNLEKYAENKTNLPADFFEVIIEGGCHAYFGMYGLQEGDGTPTISNKEQIAMTVSAIAGFIND